MRDHARDAAHRHHAGADEHAGVPGRQARADLTEAAAQSMFSHYQWEDLTHLDEPDHAHAPEVPAALAPRTAEVPVAHAAARIPLRVISFNVLLARLQATELAYLKHAHADVIYLQEASAANAKQLAAKLGMNQASYPGADCAIVTRFPITHVDRTRFAGYTPKERNANERRVRKAFKKQHPHGSKAQELSWVHESRKPRGYMAATIDVNGQPVDLVNAHLSLRDVASNTRELVELRKQIKRREGTGHKVLAGGDFNTNFAAARGTKSWQRKHPGEEVGNIRSAANRKAVRELMGAMAYWWNAAQRRVDGPHGTRIDPKKLVRLLRAKGAPKPGSAKWKRWLAAADGLTHFAMAKRFDNLFASKGATFTKSSIDHVRGSDHHAIQSDVVL